MNLRKNFTFSNIILINSINFTSEEKEMVRNWRNTESIKKWMYSDHNISPEEHSTFLKKLEYSNKDFLWLMKDDTENYLGIISINRIDYRNKNAYFAIYANPTSSIPGIGRISDKIAIELVFQVIKLHTLKLEVIEDNKLVINLHKKNGFKEEGRLKEFVLKNNIWKDVIIMGMTNKEDDN